MPERNYKLQQCLFDNVIYACSKAETEDDSKQGIPVMMFLITEYVPSRTGRGQPANAGLLLEESPKWHLLTMVLEEIHQETRKNTASMSEMNDYIQ